MTPGENDQNGSSVAALAESDESPTDTYQRLLTRLTPPEWTVNVPRVITNEHVDVEAAAFEAVLQRSDGTLVQIIPAAPLEHAQDDAVYEAHRVRTQDAGQDVAEYVTVTLPTDVTPLQLISEQLNDSDTPPVADAVEDVSTTPQPAVDQQDQQLRTSESASRRICMHSDQLAAIIAATVATRSLLATDKQADFAQFS